MKGKPLVLTPGKTHKFKSLAEYKLYEEKLKFLVASEKIKLEMPGRNTGNKEKKLQDAQLKADELGAQHAEALSNLEKLEKALAEDKDNKELKAAVAEGAKQLKVLEKDLNKALKALEALSK